MMGNFHYRNTKAAKLNLAEVAEIKRRYAEGRTQSELCKAYGVSIGQIGRIVRGESWQGVAVEPTEEEISASHERIMAALAKAQALSDTMPKEIDVLKNEMGKKDE